MDRTEQETGWFHDFAEWISYNPRTVGLFLVLVGFAGVWWSLDRIASIILAR